ncbi:hypothetical protein H2200_006910 [Cladophialophora chaetospira]|uniref:MAPEG family protein n=1 Tax=Cladophialophora chaetospira TaxID=386627 RepID=A0AA38X9A1_9EURO|nr:hypothetical protein H2200_006910 [Cladophialophora chaetospira]
MAGHLSSPLDVFVPSTNVSYYTVPVAWLLAFAPHIYAAGRYSVLTGTRPVDAKSRASDQKDKNLAFNKTSPRTFMSLVESNPRLSQDKKDELFRAEAAHSNGMENLGWFAASVVAANSAGVDVSWCNALSLWYLANRVVYNVFYVRGVGGMVRGAPFYGSIAAIVSLYIKAGNAVRR